MLPACHGCGTTDSWGLIDDSPVEDGGGGGGGWVVMAGEPVLDAVGRDVPLPCRAALRLGHEGRGETAPSAYADCSTSHHMSPVYDVHAHGLTATTHSTTSLLWVPHGYTQAPLCFAAACSEPPPPAALVSDYGQPVRPQGRLGLLPCTTATQPQGPSHAPRRLHLPQVRQLASAEGPGQGGDAPACDRHRLTGWWANLWSSVLVQVVAIHGSGQVGKAVDRRVASQR